jgi:quercetin dioxygenase-like cupin family protein
MPKRKAKAEWQSNLAARSGSVKTTPPERRTNMPTQAYLIHSSNVPSINLFGALHQLLVASAEASGAFGIVRMIVPPGVAIPLHSCADPEVFYVLEGTVEFLQYEGDSSRWLTANSGDLVCAPSDVKHAFRNNSSAPVTYLVASTPNPYNFLNELKESFHPDPSAGSPTPEEMQRLLTLVAKYNYWVASPEENTAIGLTGF